MLTPEAHVGSGERVGKESGRRRVRVVVFDQQDLGVGDHLDPEVLEQVIDGRRHVRFRPDLLSHGLGGDQLPLGIEIGLLRDRGREGGGLDRPDQHLRGALVDRHLPEREEHDRRHDDRGDHEDLELPGSDHPEVIAEVRHVGVGGSRHRAINLA